MTIEERDYRLVDIVGRGGYAVVYKAVNTSSDDEVAIKISNIVTDDGDIDDQLVQEPEMMKMLENSGKVVKVFGVEKFSCFNKSNNNQKTQLLAVVMELGEKTLMDEIQK